MFELSLDQIALKDRWLEKCKRTDWSVEDYKGLAFHYKWITEDLLRKMREVEHTEGLTNEQLLEIHAALEEFVPKITTEVGLRELEIKGFTTLAVHPLKITGLQISMQFGPVIIGAILGGLLLYLATNFPGA